MKISAVIFVSNSESTLAACLESVKFADEIIVIDTQSHDGSMAIAKGYTDRITILKNLGYVEPIRNEGVKKATGDWILVIDGDEAVPAALAKQLKKLTVQTTDVWEIPRKNLIFGSWLKQAGWWPDYQRRFFRQGTLTWSNKIHSQPEVSGKLDRLPALGKYALIHNNYNSVAEYIDRLNKYTTIEANQLKDNKANGMDSLQQFSQEFNRRFFLEKGYKAGDVGIFLAVFQAYYQFLTRVKVWEKYKDGVDNKVDRKAIAKGLKLIRQELAFWIADFEVRKTKNNAVKSYWKLRQKLRL